LFITFPQFCDKPQTQKLSDVGTVKKKRLSWRIWDYVRVADPDNKVVAVSHENSKAICKNKTSFREKKLLITTNQKDLPQDLGTEGKMSFMQMW
jgi:hypothetical protein